MMVAILIGISNIAEQSKRLITPPSDTLIVKKKADGFLKMNRSRVDKSSRPKVRYRYVELLVCSLMALYITPVPATCDSSGMFSNKESISLNISGRFGLR